VPHVQNHRVGIALCLSGIYALVSAHLVVTVEYWCGVFVEGVVGGALCSWSQEDGVIPVNKNLWYVSVSVWCL